MCDGCDVERLEKECEQLRGERDAERAKVKAFQAATRDLHARDVRIAQLRLQRDEERTCRKRYEDLVGDIVTQRSVDQEELERLRSEVVDLRAERAEPERIAAELRVRNANQERTIVELRERGAHLGALSKQWCGLAEERQEKIDEMKRAGLPAVQISANWWAPNGYVVMGNDNPASVVDSLRVTCDEWRKHYEALHAKLLTGADEHRALRLELQRYKDNEATRAKLAEQKLADAVATAEQYWRTENAGLHHIADRRGEAITEHQQTSNTLRLEVQRLDNALRDMTERYEDRARMVGFAQNEVARLTDELRKATERADAAEKPAQLWCGPKAHVVEDQKTEWKWDGAVVLAPTWAGTVAYVADAEREASLRQRLQRVREERDRLRSELDECRRHECAPPLGNPTREEAMSALGAIATETRWFLRKWDGKDFSPSVRASMATINSFATRWEVA